MLSTDQQLQKIVRLGRLQALRNWAHGLGAFAIVTAITVAGFGSVANPKNWSSAYSAMTQGGLLQWAVLPLIILGVTLCAGGIALQMVIARDDK